MHDALTGTRPVVVCNPDASDLATAFGISESCLGITWTRHRSDSVAHAAAERLGGGWAGACAPVSGTNTRSDDLGACAAGQVISTQHRRTPMLNLIVFIARLAYSPNIWALRTMRIGRNVEVRPLGGGVGCLAMILFSVIASVLLTVLVNVLARL
jgi:hypothetical protein